MEPGWIRGAGGITASFSVAAIAEANGLRIAPACGDGFLYAAVEYLAFLLDGADTQSNCSKGDCGDNGGGDLNDAISKH